MKTAISIIGLGKLGFPFAVCWAKKGAQVVGVEVDKGRLESFKEGDVPGHEPGTAELFEEVKDSMSFTGDVREAVAQTDVTFIFVGTPGDSSGKFTTDYVLSACEAIGGAIREKDAKQLIVLVSSVTAGSIDDEIIPALEKHSGKRVGDGFDFAYSPVFIALGTMIRDYFEPDFTLIGESSAEAGNRLLSLLRNFYTKSNVPTIRTNFVNAEIIKLALSTFITTKISYANMLAELCTNIPGADVDVVTQGIAVDKRVSPKAFKGGVSYGGPCFPRDNRALMYLTKKYGVNGSIVEATDRYNHYVVEMLAELALAHGKGVPIGVLGYAFKQDTDVIDESTGVELTDYLLSKGANVIGYDRVAGPSAASLYGERMRFMSSLESIVSEAPVLLIATAWEEYREKLIGVLSAQLDKRILIDPWRLFKSSDWPANVEYIPVGRASAHFTEFAPVA